MTRRSDPLPLPDPDLAARRPARLWVAIAPQARALVPRDHVLALPPAPLVPVHRSDCVQGAEPAGPWVVRAAVRLPLAHASASPPPQGARWLGALHARWLGYMGMPGVAVYDGPVLRHWASFVARAPGDVVVDGRKITSVAECRHGGETLLVASTLLRPPPWGLLCRAVGAPVADVPALREVSLAAATLLPMLDPPSWAAQLRRMLHLSLALGELLQEGLGTA